MANVKELVRTIIRETCTHWICADEQELERVETELEQKLNELIATERAQAGSSDESAAFPLHDVSASFLAHLERQLKYHQDKEQSKAEMNSYEQAMYHRDRGGAIEDLIIQIKNAR